MTSAPFGTAPVEVEVERLLPFGLLVRLADGGTGLIREREIAWDREGRRNWARRFHVGDKLQAVLLDGGNPERPELSLRLAEDDPWQRLDPRSDLGRLVEGCITGVQPYGAFVEIAPGITGLLHRSRLPHWVQSRPVEDLFWVGDQVMVTIERIDLAHRQIGLSLGRALQQRWAELPAALESAPPPATIAEPAESIPTGGGRVLVIEDDPEQLAALENWLGAAGYEVLGARSGEEGLELAAREPLDLVISDYGLPGLEGPEALLEIRRRQPRLRCALMTDWTRISDQGARVERLLRQGVRLVLKPLRPADIAVLLSEQDDPEPALDETGGGAAIFSAGRGALPRIDMAGRRRIPQLLERLQLATGAIKVVLFSLDLAQRKVQIVAEAGGPPLDRSLTTDLLYSPVRDVAEDERLFRVHDALLAGARVRYLRPMLEFRGCLGLPVPVQAAERFALFLFSARMGGINSLHEEQASAVALAIGASIERQLLLGHSQETQRLALLGQLGRALVHEINHHLGTITMTQSTLAAHIARLEQASEPGPAFERQLANVRAAHQLLARGVENLVTTAEIFSQVATPQREQTIDAASALREAAALVRDMADRAHVRLHLDIAPDLPPLAIQAVQLQQILLNVLINAIQQIELLRGAAGGHVLIRATRPAGEQSDRVELRVEDDGPGIHRRLWERIFELGFTTRHEGGSGLGLYITRSLAESLGARVRVTESRALWGSTFVISLPAQACAGGPS